MLCSKESFYKSLNHHLHTVYINESIYFNFSIIDENLIIRMRTGKNEKKDKVHQKNLLRTRVSSWNFQDVPLYWQIEKSLNRRRFQFTFLFHFIIDIDLHLHAWILQRICIHSKEMPLKLLLREGSLKSLKS